MSDKIHFVSDISKLNDLRYKKKPIIAEFYTDWCPPCKPIRSILERELKANSDKFTLVCINCDESDELNIFYEIEGVPTVIALHCDEKLTIFSRIMGYNADKFKAFIEKVNKELFTDAKI